MAKPPALTVDQLRAEIEAGDIDTVVVAFTDMQGRLQGKRLHGHYFLDHVLERRHRGVQLPARRRRRHEHGRRLRDQLLGARLRRHVLRAGPRRRCAARRGSRTRPRCSATSPGSTAAVRVAQSPRSVLEAQVDAGRGARPHGPLRHRARVHRLRGLLRAGLGPGLRRAHAANRYNVDYSILGGDRVEPLLREIRNEMYAAGVVVESAKGECNLGQHEIGFLFDEAVRTCDNHVVYRNAAKEIAARRGQSLTFMAKFDEREGSSCHIHLSLRGTDGTVFADDDREHGQSEVFDSFLAGILATQRELTYFYAPNINSYKRFAAASFAPTAVAWGSDNRTCALRVVGPRCRRCGSRTASAGGDLNPYLAVAAHARRRVARHRARARARAGARGQRLHLGQAAGARRRCSEARDLLAGVRGRPGAPSVTRSSTTTSTPPTSRSPPSTQPSPTGSAGEGSSGCEREHPRSPQPRDRGGRRDGAARVTRGGRRRDRRCPRGRADLGRGGSGRPRPAAAPLLRRRRRAPGGAGPARGGERRAHHRQRPLGGRQRPRRPRLLRGRSGAELRPADPGGRRHRPHLPRAHGRRRHHRAVELPDADRRLGTGSGPGGRQHRRAQAGRADAR